jgi:fructose-1,6-bisphosphatase/inositol monophosphatase family enzyme
MPSPSLDPGLNPEWLDPLLEEFDRLSLGAFQNSEMLEKDDGTVVTALDRDISALVTNTLREQYPDAGIISEEEKEPYLPEAAYQWVLDPIDGTASFARGYPVWGMGLGLMKDRVPVAGCLRFPVFRETYIFTGDTLYINGQPFLPPPLPTLNDVKNLLVGSVLHNMVKLEKLKSYKLRNLGSNLYHIAALAAGRCEAMITPQAYIWDIVPALPMTRARGYVERYLDGSTLSLHDLFRGTPPTYRLENPLVIGPPDLVDAIVGLLG